ncbi:DUF2889 domain-containing protein [Pseudonocardia kunmingensis]|uniref:DUF2889 family protein n=1 Tax=Pseudonocardia kunmingensis TaxID=630975 RepID=A0A543DPK9_9PSEU|nr:DUF2889 domain-containing protein [Pseudonocardia kunmingensis]TQM11235.1 DUF2889 family protein [Pseudonocardia kunmingensis]
MDQPAADTGFRMVADPAANTPVRLPFSVRRTSSMDMLRPRGLTDPTLIVRGVARDVVTDAEGVGTVSAQARLDAEVRFDASRALVALTTSPACDTERLLGLAVASGFRAAADRALDPDEHGGVLALLLDDLPVAVLIAGYALALTRELPAEVVSFVPKVDLCSGWRDDGVMVASLRRGERMPLRLGPPAPVLDRPDDPLSWHPTQPLAPLAMRRRRRIDLVLGERDRGCAVEAMFRDTYVDPDDGESVVHEYELHADLTRERHLIGGTASEALVLGDVHATPRVLPWPECPVAAASAARISGTPVSEVAGHVRSELRGTPTCTHLNDLLRSLAGVEAMARQST